VVDGGLMAGCGYGAIREEPDEACWQALMSMLVHGSESKLNSTWAGTHTPLQAEQTPILDLGQKSCIALLRVR
jgi:hypothetical protein